MKRTILWAVMVGLALTAMAQIPQVDWDQHSLKIDGKRICPVMGEVHYSRIPADEWAAEVRKMKEGGVTIIATYVFWNHVEEQEGIFRWEGQRNLRRFIEICKDQKIPVVLRLGPFCHGEVRNGGIPDWVFTKGCKTRDENPVFLGMVERLYRQIFTQIQGLQWKDGGPVIAAQFDNEYRGRGEYLMALKKIATEIGFDLPFYTRTGWPELATPVPFGEMLPLYGDYADGFWERSIEETAGNYYKAFNFSASQVSGAIGSEQLDYSTKATANHQYPYFTCELGGGMMTAYHRRPYIYPEDAYSMAIVKLGSGSNLLGYYMYHGGTNPDGLTYLNETQRTVATNYNDLPVKTYDFQAPLNEFGQKNPQYYMLRKLHLFMQDWGDVLAPMEAAFPCKQDIQKGNDSFLRWSIRTKGGSGFIFVNNYERLQNLSAKKGVQLEACGVKLPKLNIPAGTMCIFPVNIDGIRYATAQLVAKRDGKIYLEQIKGIPTTLAIGNRVLRNLKANGSEIPVYQNYYLLTSEQAEHLFLNEEGHHDLAYNAPKINKIKEAGPLRKITIGVNKVAEEPVDEDFEQAAVYTIDLPAIDRKGLLLNIDYRGDVARLYADGKLIDDNFYNGRPFQYALWRLPKDCRQLELRILPLQKDMPVYFPREADTTPGEKINQISIIQIGFPAQAQTLLSYGFDHPQDSARTKVWWFHGETIGTHEGITADLAAFKEQGVGGVVYYDQVHGKGEGAFKVFSPEWWDELIFSSQEAKRIGLDFECNASNGYVAGGSWITPDKSMQRLATTELVVEGGRDLLFQMPLVKTPGDWHQDVALIALPYDDSRLAQIPMNGLTATADEPFTARSITYEVTAQGKARTSSMQVPPFSPRVGDMRKGEHTKWDFFGCGFQLLPPVGELQASADGITYYKICDLRPRYRNLGGIHLQTVAFPQTTARYFRIVPNDTTVTFSQVTLSARASVDAWQEKASLISEIIECDHTPRYNAEELVDFSKAIDLSDKIDEKGQVTWKSVPTGKWLVLRFLSVSTGGHTKHGRAEALGLECDKLSVEGARLQWKSYVKPIIDSIRIHNGRLTGICMDSHEAGPQNWTIGFEKEFKRLRGYDMRKYLLVMAGLVVGSAEESDKFLYDLRHTINDLITDKYFGEFNRLCREEGLVLTAQAIGGALCMAGDAISVKKLVDKPQAEFWGYQTEGNYDIKDCSSAAHLYGKQIASGEAFTDITYKETLAGVKNLADYAYSFGINEFVVCAVAYQPWVRKGDEPLKISTANGRQYVLNRLNTFWPMSKPFWDYQARCSWVLRQGKPVSDFCLYLGDNIPARILSHKLPEFPQGYDFDAFTTDALWNRMIAQEGRILLPDGVSYRMMILPVDGQLTAEAQQQIETFRQQGVPVYDPQTDQRTLAEAIREAGLRPDVEAPSVPNLYFCHRRTEAEDIYFLNNHSDQAVEDIFRFNVTVDKAELWNPVTGERIPLKVKFEDGCAFVELTMAPHESYFVVFGESMGQPHDLGKGNEQVTYSLDSPWQVQFDPAMGGTIETMTVDKLGDWTKSENPSIRYYSGTVVCKSIFNMDKINEKSTYRLNLPLLNTAAEVIVNGRSAGIIWCDPYDLDITSYMKKGKNSIELRIANSLWNRLVGDASLPEQERVTWQTHPLANSSDELVPSGVKGEIVITIKQ